jgi:hypothetical protein
MPIIKTFTINNMVIKNEVKREDYAASEVR